MIKEKDKKINLIIALLITVVILSAIFGIGWLIYRIRLIDVTVKEGTNTTTTIYLGTNQKIPTNSDISYNVWNFSCDIYDYSEVELENLIVTSNSELEESLLKILNLDLNDFTNRTQLNSDDDLILKNMGILKYFDDYCFNNCNNI